MVTTRRGRWIAGAGSSLSVAFCAQTAAGDQHQTGNDLKTRPAPAGGYGACVIETVDIGMWIA